MMGWKRSLEPKKLEVAFERLRRSPVRSKVVRQRGAWSGNFQKSTYPWSTERSPQDCSNVRRHVLVVHAFRSFHEAMQGGYVVLCSVLHEKLQVF